MHEKSNKNRKILMQKGLNPIQVFGIDAEVQDCASAQRAHA